MSDKTKAAMQGRQYHYQKLKQKQHTRPAAGGQSPSALASASSKLRRGLSIFGPTPQITQILGDFRVANMQLGRGYAPLPHTQEISRSFGRHPDIGYRCSDMSTRLNFALADFIQLFGGMVAQSTTFAASREFGSGQSFLSSFNQLYPALSAHTTKIAIIQSKGVLGINIHYSSHLVLVCLRWRRLISPFTAVTINCAFVSPASRLLSNSETTSCGKRALSCCDLLLVEPVAITGSPCGRCDSVYANKMIIKGLKCDSLESSFKNRGAIHLVSAKPGSARNTNRASNQTVNWSNDHGFH